MDQTNFVSTTNSIHFSNKILNYFVQQNDSYSLYCGQLFVTMYVY